MLTIRRLPQTTSLLLAATLTITACGGGDSIKNSLRHDSSGVFRQPASLNTAETVSLAEGFHLEDLAELAKKLEEAATKGENLSFTPQSRTIPQGKSRTPTPRRISSDETACKGGGSVRVQQDTPPGRFSKIVQYNRCITPTAQGNITLDGSTTLTQTFQSTNPGSRSSDVTQSFEVIGTRDGATVLALNGSLTGQTRESNQQLKEEFRSPRIEMQFGNQYWARKDYLRIGEYQLDEENNIELGSEQLEYTTASTRLGGYVTVSTLQPLQSDSEGCYTQGILRYEGRHSHAELRFGDDTGTAAFATLELSNGSSRAFTNCSAVMEWMNRQS